MKGPPGPETGLPSQLLRKMGQEDRKFKASLDYSVNLKPAWAASQDALSG